MRLAQARDEQADHGARVVARVAVVPGAQVADGVQQPEGVHAGLDLPGRGRGVQQLRAHGHEPVEEVGVQRLPAGVVGLQRRGQPVLGHQEVDEQVDPLRQRLVRGAAAGQQGRAGLHAGLDLVVVDGDDQVGPGREVAVDRAHPDSGPGRDVADRRLHPGADEHGGGCLEQDLLVAAGVSPLFERRSPGLLIDRRHVPPPIVGLQNGALLRILSGATLRLLSAAIMP